MAATFSLVIMSSPATFPSRLVSILRSSYEGGFSKTARWGRRPSTAPRPHRGQLDTVRSHHRTMPRPIPAGRLTDDPAEGPAERPQTGEADVEADVGDGAVISRSRNIERSIRRRCR